MFHRFEMMTESVCCRSEEVAAYLDGELGVDESLSFEEHLRACTPCAEILREQRLLLCELDLALGSGGHSLSLPKNFAAIVSAHAQADMSGLRSSRKEHVRAFRLCAALLSLSLLFLGGAAISQHILRPAINLAERALSIANLFGHALYDAGAGLSVLSRSASGHFIFESPRVGAIALVSFVVSLALLPLLIIGYHQRAQDN